MQHRGSDEAAVHQREEQERSRGCLSRGGRVGPGQGADAQPKSALAERAAGQVLQGLVLQVEIVLLLRCMRNFQYELLACSGLEIEVGVMLPWQRTHLGLQTVQFESDAAGILYSEISCLMIDVQHEFTQVLL